MAAPRIFLAFSNKQDSYLEKLRDEFMFITDASTDLKQAGKIDYEPLQDADSAILFKRLAKWQENITVFHYGGHAKSLYFELRGDKEQYGIKQLTSLLKGEKLKLVFLNGCSTIGMVQEVFNNTNAKAVIATSVDIDDDMASLFCKRFYEVFIGGFHGGASLLNAFNAAVEHLERKPKGIKRGSFSLKKLGVKDDDSALEKKCPWGLFNKDEEILNWKINPGGFEAPEIEEGLKIKIESLNERMKKVYRERCDLTSFHSLLQKFHSLDESDDQYQALLKAKKYIILEKIEALHQNHASIEKAREAISFDRDQKRKEYSSLYKEKCRILEKYYNQDRYSCIKDALFNINFDDQKPLVRAGIKEEPVHTRAFVLQGTQNSAHNLLIDCLSREPEILPEIRIAKIDFNPSFKSVPTPVDEKMTLWDRVFRELFPGFQKGKGFGEENMIEKVRTESASGHIVFIFDRVYEQLLKVEAVKTSLEDFWVSLKDGLSVSSGRPEGRGCEISRVRKGQTAPVVGPGKKDSVFERRPNYKVLLLINLIKSQEKSPIQGLPEDFSFLGDIPRIKPEYLLIWQGHTKGFLSFLKNDYRKLFGQEGEHVLPTIEELCKQALGAEGKDFFDENFSKYKYKEFEL